MRWNRLFAEAVDFLASTMNRQARERRDPGKGIAKTAQLSMGYHPKKFTGPFRHYYPYAPIMPDAVTFLDNYTSRLAARRLTFAPGSGCS